MGRLEHDFYYIENWSVAFDLYIILRTFKTVVSGDNAY
jgi:lipopolysaccharide/colanic/teichoic acid biosynthesis glycosyltransferase